MCASCQVIQEDAKLDTEDGTIIQPRESARSLSMVVVEEMATDLELN